MLKISFLCSILIVYSGDTGPNDNLKRLIENADLFICESSLLKGQYRSDNNHMYAYEAGKLASGANVKKL